MNIKILSTTHKILNDILNMLSVEKPESFEVGCRCTTAELQDHFYRVLCLIFLEHKEIEVGVLAEENVVYVKYTTE